MQYIIQLGIFPLSIIHIIGLILGLGLSTALDLWLIRSIFRQTRFSNYHFKNIILVSKLIVIGLLLLWFSGVGFLCFYYFTDPDKLLNPKIWSKLIIVGILTLNGIFIHYKVLSELESCIGKSLLASIHYRTLGLLFTCGSISFVSWYFPFIYGMSPGLNFAYSFVEFMLAYLIVLLIVIFAGQALLGFLNANYNDHYINHQKSVIKKLIVRLVAIPKS